LTSSCQPSLVQQSWATFCQEVLNPRSPQFAAGIGIFLVSVPVFFEAPLVRSFPLLSLALTGLWWGLGYYLLQRPHTAFWGDLLLGFSWSWLAGSLYWGWLRWEPLLHLPVEAIGLPLALWGLYQGSSRVGHCFYLGSLLGTAVTDLYFYWVGVMPYWRQIMQVEPEAIPGLIQAAMTQVQTPEGLLAAGVCGMLLCLIGLKAWQWSPTRSDPKPAQIQIPPELPAWIFSGTIFGTLLVDSLFGLLAVV
jgi:hypothetical protein